MIPAPDYLKSNERDPLIGGIFKLKKKIGAGSFGSVYQGFNKFTSELVAVKLEKMNDKNNQTVNYEAAILKHLSLVEGVPEVLWSGKHENYEILVLPLFGKDFGTYMKLLKRFPLKKVLGIGLTLLQILENCHKRGVLHRDLKPENIMMGRENDSKIYLIDFGISKTIFDSNGNHICFRDGKSFIGTCRYASLAAHEGKELGRKDDLESLGFVLLYLLQGSLPWQEIYTSEKERLKEVGKMKKEISLEILCKDLPIEFITYFKYCRSLGFSEKPNYKFLRDIFHNIAERENINLSSQDSVEWSQTSYLAIKKRKKTTSKRTSCQNLIEKSLEFPKKNEKNETLTPKAKKKSVRETFESSLEIQKPKLVKTKSSLLNPNDLTKSKSKSGLFAPENSMSVSYSSLNFSQARSICIEGKSRLDTEDFGGLAEYFVHNGKEVQYPEDTPQFKMMIIRQFEYFPNFIEEITSKNVEGLLR